MKMIQLTDNEQRIADVLVEYPRINNRDLEFKSNTVASTRNLVITSLYRKFGLVDGASRDKRSALIDVLKAFKEDG